MQQPTILIIEDDEVTSSLIADFLKDCNFTVERVFNAEDGISHIKYKHIDLIILDINLPDFNGFELLKSVRTTFSIPVIITSANSDTQSKVLAFKYGANDYMVKPIDLEELEARIWVHLGRYSQITIQSPKKPLELFENQIFFHSKPLDLTTTEFEILKTLIENTNQITSREELIANLSAISSPRSLDNHIKNIRKKLNDTGSKPKYIKTEYGLGYKLINQY